MFYFWGNLKITFRGDSDDLFSRVLKFAILVAIIVRLVILNDEYILLGVVIFSELLHSRLESKSFSKNYFRLIRKTDYENFARLLLSKRLCK